MKNQKGFISMSLIFSFFLLFIAVMIALLVDYAHTRNMIKVINKDIIMSLEKNTKALNEAILEQHTPIPDNVASTYVISASGIDFNAISSPTNGQGLYTNVKNGQDGKTKYFRGGTYCAYTDYSLEDENGTKCIAVGGSWSDYHCSLNDSKSACTAIGGTYYELKNNVMFGGYAWKIVKINSDGSIKIIYNGTNPTSRGELARIGKSPYDKSTTAGGTATSLAVALEELSYTGGNLKDKIDIWYNTNLSGLGSYLADSKFCNDLNYTTGTIYYFGSRNRYVAGTPSFNCETNDTYTVANGKLSVPMAPLNVDEATYAGAKYATHNYTYYLQSGSSYWTTSPYNYNTTSLATNEFFVHTYGYTGATLLKSNHGVRPVINLKPDVLVLTGDGSLSNPLVIKVL